MRKTLYVGTYSHPDFFGEDKGFAGRGEGVYRLSFDEETGRLTQEASYPQILNPSYLTLSADGRLLFCVHELDTFQGADGGGVSAYDACANGLKRVSARSTGGGAPCHVALRPDGRQIAVSNYSGGSVSALAVDAAGRLGEARVIRHHGAGHDPERQDAPHVHSAIYTAGGAQAIVCDLGLDTVTAYPSDGGGLFEAGATIQQTGAGDGPRMCAVDATRGVLYVLCEISSRMLTLPLDAFGTPRPVRSAVSTLPDGAKAKGNTAADLRLGADGRRLYATNRGHDSISVFDVDDAGALSLVQSIPSGGRTPRGFTLSPSGRWLLCGHQDGDTVAVFRVEPGSGALAQEGSFALPSPVCLVFAP